MEASLQTPPANPQALLENKRQALLAAARRGTDWFFWIAGLSIVNTVIYLTGSSTSFMLGLGITQLVDILMTRLAQRAGANSSTIILLVGIFIDLFFAALFIGAGFLARKRIGWVVIAGMLLYLLDGAIYVLAEDWLAALFHLWALFSLWQGWRVLSALKKLEQTAFPYQPEPVVINPLDSARQS